MKAFVCQDAGQKALAERLAPPTVAPVTKTPARDVIIDI